MPDSDGNRDMTCKRNVALPGGIGNRIEFRETQPRVELQKTIACGLLLLDLFPSIGSSRYGISIQ